MQRFTPAVIPNVSGVSLKPQHFDLVLGDKPSVGWFEIHPENYLMAGGPMIHSLNKIRQNYSLSFHSVGMSLGSFQTKARAREFETHLKKIKILVDRFEPAFISDHLSWSSWDQFNFNDLLPVPYSQKNLKIMLANINKAQTILGRSIAIENPSSYLNFEQSTEGDLCLDECEFLVRLAQESGATILLDVNNVFVSANNNGWSAKEYIDNIPAELITEIHLAGHSRQNIKAETILIDDHGSRVCDEVWALYAYTVEHVGNRPTLIEWDTDVPEFSVLKEEADRANSVMADNSLFASEHYFLKSVRSEMARR